jgi:hypothetical protein
MVSGSHLKEKNNERNKSLSRNGSYIVLGEN